jgi:hypothetical protein
MSAIDPEQEARAGCSGWLLLFALALFLFLTFEGIQCAKENWRKPQIVAKGVR